MIEQHRYRKLLIRILTAGSILYLAFFVIMQRTNAFEFPITELGNCRNYRECHLFCEVPANKATCWSYSVYGHQTNVLGDETPEAKIAELGITFPIAELGNCASLIACKAYCNVTQNQTACQTFAKSRGLVKKELLVEKAQEELGCNSQETCKAFCEQESNQDACRSFAKRYHLKGIVKTKLVEIAQTELGCNSQEECRVFCALAENREKCSQLLRSVSPNHGQTRKEQLVASAKEQLGCTSFEDCKAFCQDETNKEKCRNFGSAVSGRLNEEIKRKIQEIGNCTTVDECRKVCAENPDKCPNYPSLKNQGSPSGQRLLQKKTDTATRVTKPLKPSVTENKQEFKTAQQITEQKTSPIPEASPTTETSNSETGL